MYKTTGLLWLVLTATAFAMELNNGDFCLILSNEQGVPLIESGEWVQQQQLVFQTDAAAIQDGSWGPDELSLPELSTTSWQREEDANFLRARFTAAHSSGLVSTCVVELARSGSLFRLYRTVQNNGVTDRRVDWYPVWQANWRLPEENLWLRTWEALSFKPYQERLAVDAEISLSSRVHSSDRRPNGFVPHWIIGSPKDRLNFSLSWCGGWSAEISQNNFGAEWSVWLPPEETQLQLAPGESVTGPIITVVVTSAPEEQTARTDWLMQRCALGKQLYGSPADRPMLIWNHWYSVEFDVNADYLLNQLNLLEKYGFDAFVIDAGWYQHIGDWGVNSNKFTSAAQLKQVLKTVKSKGMKAGLWSCPQFGRPEQNNPGQVFEEPVFYRPFLSDTRLYDLVGMNFESFLVDHVGLLVNEYGADWWKYDQDFFARRSKAGLLKNVEEFQRGLEAVRRKFPNLIIENCQSGGRMINDFTTFATDIHWLADGGDTGYPHARTNITEVLGALQFLPYWTCQRWNNRYFENDPHNDELTRFYCRSAMPGVWGISEDLSKVDSRQLEIIQQEIINYRRLNTIKSSMEYDIVWPEQEGGTAKIIYYNESHTEAAILLFRWNQQGRIQETQKLPPLSGARTYCIERCGGINSSDMAGWDLAQSGFQIELAENELSALYFIQPRKAAIVLFGDSITRGGDWQKLLNRDDVKNSGYPGFTTGHFVWLLNDAVITAEPKICFVMGGVNDLGVGVPVETVFGHLRDITLKLRAQDIRPILQSTLNQRDTGEQNLKIVLLNGLLKEFAAQQQIDFLDVNSRLSTDGNLKPEFTTDGTHLTPAAYAVWAEMIVSFLSKYGI